MTTLDTNILVRFLVRDDKKQAKLVYDLFKQTEDKGQQLLVPLVVVLKLIWVLESAYKQERLDILTAIEDLMHMPILQFESDEIITALITHGKGTSIDLSDLLIACSAQAAGGECMITFDKKASRFPFFKILK